MWRTRSGRRAGIGLAGPPRAVPLTMAIRKSPPAATSSPISERAAALESEAVRVAARQFLSNDGKPPAGLGPSRHQDVWIDLGDGEGAQPFPPKVILAIASGGALPEREGYASAGVWRKRLAELGFPVLPKGKRPGRGVSCRGADLDGSSSTRGSTARARPHVAAYRALAPEHLRAAALGLSEENSGQSDTYAIWIDGTAYPFWPLFRSAVKAAGGTTRQRPRQRKGHQPEHDLVRKHFAVLPRGITPIPAAKGTQTAPSPDTITVAALKQAAQQLELAPEFRDRREGLKFDLWVEGDGPYPVKAMVLLAWHSLGLGWHEDWTKGGPASRTNKHLQSLPRVQILSKGDSPDADGGRTRTLAEDLKEIEQSNVDNTTRKRLIDARLGQGWYRGKLADHWGGACAVTGIAQNQVLRASHIVPWRENVARLDPHNGLLLVATLDCLFDRGLISFAKDGTLLIGNVRHKDRAELGLDRPRRLRDAGLTKARLGYLEWHRKEYGFPND